MKRPNILWLMSDQHNARCLGSAGHPDVRTPHLDELAREGVQFSRAYCNNPICGPSRACFISGQYPHTHGILGNDIWNYNQTLPRTVARHFREHGYQTALIGKAHLPKLWLHDGFEHLRFCDLADAERNDPLSCHYFRYLVENGLGDLYDQGRLPATHPGARQRAFTSEIPLAHSLEVWTGDQTLQWLQTRDEERPFFLQMSFQRPHEPLAPSLESADLYCADELTLPASARDYFANQFAGKPEYQRAYVNGGTEARGGPYRPHDEADLKRQLAHYYALISTIDAQIGRVFDWLKQTGEWENTIVCYHADHGDFAGEHGLMLKNLGVYESIHRIPFLWKWPACPAGQTRDELVESVDLAPTFCDLAGLLAPTEFEGRSLRAVIGGEAAALDITVCEYDHGGPSRHFSGGAQRALPVGVEHGASRRRRTLRPPKRRGRTR